MAHNKDETLRLYRLAAQHWHQSGGDVYHTSLNCSESQKITEEDTRPGNGDLPLCEECEELEQTGEAKEDFLSEGLDTGRRGGRGSDSGGKKRRRRKGRGGQIAIVCTVGFLVLGGVVSVSSWEFFKREAETIRNLVLMWGAPLALGLAMWRSLVAQRQVTLAEKGVLDARYQRAVEMLGHDFLSVRVGGIRALRNLALEHPQYDREVVTVLNLYAQGKRWEPMVKNEELDIEIPADEWEAVVAAKRVYEAKKSRGRKTGL